MAKDSGQFLRLSVIFIEVLDRYGMDDLSWKYMDNLIWELSVKMAFCLRLELVCYSLELVAQSRIALH